MAGLRTQMGFDVLDPCRLPVSFFPNFFAIESNVPVYYTLKLAHSVTRFSKVRGG